MDGLLFLIFWIGGAAIHTLVEVHWRSARARKMVAIGTDGRHRKYDGESL